MDGDETLQKIREQRLTTLQLADQVKEDHWRDPVIPGDRTIHDVLAHILAWDEWAIGVFEISALRELPESMRRALADVDAFNERAVARFKNITRDDMIASLQNVSARVASSARSVGGADWSQRRLPDLAPQQDAITLKQDQEQEKRSRGPKVGSILRTLLQHEAEHAQEIADAFNITAPATPNDAKPANGQGAS